MVGHRMKYYDYLKLHSNELTVPYYICTVSGGKDSLYMLHYIINHDMPLNEVVAVDVPFCNPLETIGINHIQELCSRCGIPFKRLTHQKYNMYSTFNFRGAPIPHKDMWCHDIFKSSVLDDYYYSLVGKSVFEYVGFCSNEKKRDFRHRAINSLYPLMDNGIDEYLDILPWARECDVWQGWYKEFNRLGCPSCPYMDWSEEYYRKMNWLLQRGFDVFDLHTGKLVKGVKL